ncbi:gluconokinase [Actinomadura barringtoniae]|uniref:Gluconokinase n=2 Tax=Actinomadura barringtoniae TaxID=1427535 RepID=A0A939PEB0_9ACTN|nr:gluconokinase [Actinomadura barringtoniae]
MGVSGSGKTTIGELLGRRLGWEYADADHFHPKANIEKMAAGQPLTDVDRAPWLGAIAQWVTDHLEHGTPGVVSCSALRRRYRDQVLLNGRPDVKGVYLDGDRDLIAERMRIRPGHFFKVEMLDTQFEALELPEPDEHILSVPVNGTPEETVELILKGLDLNV